MCPLSSPDSETFELISNMEGTEGNSGRANVFEISLSCTLPCE
jgi:hypothetical protein